MNGSKAFKLLAGAGMITAITAYNQTAVHMHGGVLLLLLTVTFLLGYFAGEDI
ncbi:MULTISPECIES: hypothetical protein [Pseudomonas]|uniref:hypothetical protein n=1 Tax=Pseudomonas TaxID=286 RepID=UPI0023618E65|nr:MULTISPECIES: hypothetical protein [Pseudomonas]WJV25894.1 hypothetical protein PSR66_07660 [Pseudomonas chlororaphis]